MSNKKVVTKTIEKNKWEELLQKSFEKNVKKAKVDGFRDGKCPRNVYEKKYGVESLYDDALNMELPNLYTEILKETKIIPVVEPSIDIKSIDENGVTIEFTIVSAPEVEIKKYKGLGVKKDKVKVTKEEITEEVNRMKENFAEIEIKDSEIENGDTAVIDFEGFKDGVAFEGGKGENYPLEIGSNTFIPGFEEALVGHKTNDEVDVNVTFPEDYPAEELKGAKVVFKVKVHEVKTRVLPKLDKDFFADLDIEGVNSKEELENYCKDNLTHKKEHEVEDKFVDDLLKAVAEETTIDIPEELTHDEVHHMLDNYNQRLQMQGLSLDQYLAFSKKSIEDFEEELKPEANKNIKYSYMIEKIAKDEKITISDEDVDAEVEKLAIEYDMTKEELVKAYGGKEMIRYDLMMRKTIDFLKENN